MTQPPVAFFLPVESPVPGQRFCIFHPAQLSPGSALRGRVVYIHPFAEEMNKSRRMAALQSRALAAAGFSVLQIDLLGCGDSSGDFGDASWQDWIDDVVRACSWLRARDATHAAAPSWLWGLRAGCLLAVGAAKHIEEELNFCFWHPFVTQKLALQQFLRLKVAADMLTGNSRGVMDSLRKQLSENKSIEIAGYLLAPALANGLDAAQLEPPNRQSAGRLAWIDVSMRAEAEPAPAATQVLANWERAMYAVHHHQVQGPSFWMTTEIEDAPNLIAATIFALAHDLALT